MAIAALVRGPRSSASNMRRVPSKDMGLNVVSTRRIRLIFKNNPARFASAVRNAPVGDEK
jgi:hypothetical protein